MKKFIPLLIAIVSFTSCAKENSKIERTESGFGANLGLKFIFLDESNRDLIEKSNIKSYPITFKDNYSEISSTDIIEYDNKVIYNGNINTLTYNAEISKNVWQTIVYGFDNISEYETYVLFENNSVDTILVNYSFSTGDCMGRDYCPEITKVYYNGKPNKTRIEIKPAHNILQIALRVQWSALSLLLS
ncbi:MAG: hypothetical protein ACYC25_15590 [Paludibacter sp.]